MGVDAREIVAAAKEMSMENAKVPASWVTAGQADRLRARFGGHKELKAKLERRQQYRETGELAEEVQKATHASKAHTPKLGKASYEHDRRGIFGVVETAGGVRVETPAPRGLHAKPAVTGITKPAPQPATPDKPHNLAAELPAPKKFLGIQVNPPIRREPTQPDDRFGVVVPAPVSEKPAEEKPAAQPPADLWGKLNDGRPPVEMPAPPAVESVEEPEPEEKAELATPEPVEVEEPVAAEKPAAIAEPPPAVEHHAPSHAHHAPRKHEAVPVKMQPKHKAFGAKMKVKHKKHKELQEATKSKAHHKPAHSESHAPKKHEQTPAHQPKKSERQTHKPEGLLKRLARTFLGK